MIKVQQMQSNKGNYIANQFEIYNEATGDVYFQSYNSIIACKRRIMGIGNTGYRIELDATYWNYSKTTSKYRSMFLNETTEETKKKIKSGEYILSNLN